MRAAPGRGAGSSRRQPIQRCSPRSPRSHGAGEGARCPPERVGPPAARRPNPHPRAAPRAPRAPRPAPAGGLGYRPRTGRMHGRRRRRGGRGAGSDRAPGGASAPLTQLSASLLSLTFLHRLPGTSMAAAPAPGSQNRRGRATRTPAGQGRAGRAGGGAFASGLARADVRTRSCSRLRLRRVAAAPPKWVRGRGTWGGAKRTRRTLRPPGSEEGAGPGKAVVERPRLQPCAAHAQRLGSRPAAWRSEELLTRGFFRVSPALAAVAPASVPVAAWPASQREALMGLLNSSFSTRSALLQNPAQRTISFSSPRRTPGRR